MIYIRYINKLFFSLLGVPLYFLSMLSVRNKNIMVFGEWHGESYCDNSKYLFEYASNKNDSNKIIWITKNKKILKEVKDKGFLCEYAYSFRGVLYCLRAEYAFVTHSSADISQNFLGGCTLINLTHGTPLKKIGKDAGYKRLGRFTYLYDNYISNIIPKNKKINYVFCASEDAKKRFESAYRYPVTVLAFGYPRWEGLVNKEVALKDVILGYDKVISYLPTLRFNNHIQLDPFSFEGFLEFLEYLKDRNYLLIVRPHPSMVVNENKVSGNVVFIKKNQIADVNEVLKVTDFLVSDYSSVIYDFQITRKPVLLLAPDADTYINKDVGVYGDYYSEFDCPIVCSWSALIPHIESEFSQDFLLQNNSLKSSEKIYSYMQEL